MGDDVRSLPDCGTADQFISGNDALSAADYTRVAAAAMLDIHPGNKG